MHCVCGYKESYLGYEDMGASLRLILSLLFDSDTTAKVIPFKNAANKARADERAESMLDRYGNSILRLAYSYLHNISDCLLAICLHARSRLRP